MPQQQDPPLSQARQEFTDAIWQEATACPCCGRFAMVAFWWSRPGAEGLPPLEFARGGGSQMAWVKAQDVYHHLRNGEGAAKREPPTARLQATSGWSRRLGQEASTRRPSRSSGTWGPPAPACGG